MRYIISKAGRSLALPTISAGTAATTTDSVLVKMSGGTVFSVADYGAVGNGVADDSKAIQDAINACYAVGGGTVYLPAGTYRVASYSLYNGAYDMPVHLPDNPTGANDCGHCVFIRSGVHLQGAGKTQTYVVCDYTAGSHHPLASVAQKNVGVSHMDVSSSAAVEALGNVDGIKIYGCANVDVHDVVVHDTGYVGIAVYSASDSFITDCEVYNCVNAIAPSESAYLMHIDGVDQVTDNVYVSGCYAHDNSGAGFRSSGILAVQTPLVQRRCTGVTFENCTATANGSGFFPSYSANMSYIDCTTDKNTTNFAIWGVDTALLHNVTFVTPPGGDHYNMSDYNHTVYGDNANITVE